MEKETKSRIGFQRSAYELEFDFKTSFFFNKSSIYTVTQSKFEKLFPDCNSNTLDSAIVNGVDIPKWEKRKSEYGYLIIESSFDLEPYDSLNEGAARIRPNLCVILGILSFLTNEVFIPAQSFASHLTLITNHFMDKTVKVLSKCRDIDLSIDLERILKMIETDKEKQILFFTVFERWRKALYLEKESEESEVFTDESVLAYMHVLEVLSDDFEEILKVEIDAKKNQLGWEIINAVKSITQDPNEIIKMLNKLGNLNVSLKAKIFQLLISLNLDSLKARVIVSRFVEHRNAIAHGRKNLYQEKLIFPLPQFFSFIKDVDEDVEVIKILVARCISKFFNIGLWEEEWEYTIFNEITPLQQVKEFLEEKVYLQLSNENFINGSLNGITPDTISFYYKKGKVTFSTLESALKRIILSVTLEQINYSILFEAAVILSDSKNKKLATKSEEIVITTFKERWYYHSNIRDVIKDYEYHNKKLVWFKEWLTISKRMD